MYQRVRNMREDHDLTQKQMGKIVNYSQRNVSSYENGKTDIPSGVWMKLADYYGTSVDYLMGRTDVKEPYPKAEKGKDSGEYF